MADQRKVLVAESNGAAAAELTGLLRRQGCEVLSATDAVFVLTLALRHKPNAVILGAQLPVGGALMALRRLRSSVHTAAIPVLALVEPGAQKQALLTAGVEECLDLPTSAQEIAARLEARLNASRPVVGAPVEILSDSGRLSALEETGLLDTDPDEELDIVTRLAAQLLRAPVALVSLVDDKRQFFKSQIGLPTPWDQRRQTPLSHSFCQWVVSSDQELAVADARAHPVLCTNRAVSELGVVAYAGVPLSAETGHTIGAFCAVDGKPRSWSNDELATLRDLAQIVDAYSVLSRVQAPAAGPGAVHHRLRVAARAAGRGFLGAARLLRRSAGTAEDRETLLGIIERHSHQLVAAAAPISSDATA